MKYFSKMFLKVLITFILCAFYVNCLSSIEYQPFKNNILLRALRNADENIAYDYHYPCTREIVEMAKPAGQLTHATNYWNGRVDLSEFTYLKTIKFVIRVTQPAKIIIDPEVGTITGAKTGKVFRVTFKGEPSNVAEVRFQIVGTMGTLFPNLLSMHLNNRDICKGALTVSFFVFAVINMS